MKIAGHIRPVGTWDATTAIDRVVLDADERRRRRVMLTGEGSTKFLLDLDRPTLLRDGDGLVLGDGAIIRVVAKPEALVEVSAPSAQDRLRLAWHIGNRHTNVQVVGDRLRIRCDHVLEEMLRGLGAELTPVEAPFEPEGGAYTHGRSHAHGHGAQNFRRDHGHEHGDYDESSHRDHEHDAQ
jgi:urease accessory protein